MMSSPKLSLLIDVKICSDVASETVNLLPCLQSLIMRFLPESIRIFYLSLQCKNHHDIADIELEKCDKQLIQQCYQFTIKQEVR